MSRAVFGQREKKAFASAHDGVLREYADYKSGGGKVRKNSNWSYRGRPLRAFKASPYRWHETCVRFLNHIQQVYKEESFHVDATSRQTNRFFGNRWL